MSSSATPIFKGQIRELPTVPPELPEEVPSIASNAKKTITSTLISQDLSPGSPLRRSPRLKQSVSSKLALNTRKPPLSPIRDHDKVSKVRGSRTPSIKLGRISRIQEHRGSTRSTQCNAGKCSNRVRLFDDSPDCIDSSKRKSAEEFIAFYNDFKNKHEQLLASTQNNNVRTGKLPEFRISVCIIDTGIDKSHPAIKGALREDRIQGYRSWVGNEDDVHDNYGHGTHVADIILNASENVDLYIAKVADGLDIEPHGISKIAEAISYATTVWNVDILTMSFGFLEIELDVKKAIDDALRRGKLLFASASNHGNNQMGRTYPAKHRNVISISASTGKGKDGQISPSPESNDDNFMTLGIAVPLIWKGKRVYKSGTSYATPIAAGFAINALEFVFRVMGQEHFKELKQSDDFMRCVLRLMSKEDPSGYRFVAPWLLWDGRKTADFVSHLLRHAMYNK
ncbi:peptidase S8/S53 domain-containing protein [Daldinia caldariorum]|uniref:peptidase S8/S53 domain-containing protein n=1 Tax=Daldinia caldariorum TaxID=326644 RepID=UPI002007C4C9|nr:peptidase S8/S53 domain-containing protein [Daldinia caldariorum]KAI1463101.1 peptidase S8/S53 domain-containing protein [Daldinia caldariorum]